MNDDSRIALSRPAASFAVIVLLVIGAGTTYFLMPLSTGSGRREQVNTSASAATPTAPSSVPSPPLQEVVLTLSKEAMERAGIEVVPVAQGIAGTSAVRIPGTVEPNAYKQVIVTPLVSGRVTRVLAELGDQVRQGQTLLQIFSPELADAQTRYSIFLRD